MAIQIKRGKEDFNPSTSGSVLLDGQLFYSKFNKQLYVGDGIQPVMNLDGIEMGLPLQSKNDFNTTFALRTADDKENPASNNLVVGYTAVGLGRYNKVYSGYSQAFGYNNFVCSRYALAVGAKNYVGKPQTTQATIEPNQDITPYVTYLNSLPDWSDDFSINGDGIKTDDSIYNPRLAACTAVFGSQNAAYAPNGIICGTNNLIHTTAVGTTNNFIFGYQNKVTGSSSGAMGSNNNVSGNNSVAIGENLLITKHDKIAFGKFNKEVGYINNGEGYESDSTILEIGFGNSTTRKNVFEIYRSGVTKVFHAPVRDNDVLRWQEKTELETKIETHELKKNNPHAVTKAQVDLGSVANFGQTSTPAENSNLYFTANGAALLQARLHDEFDSALSGAISEVQTSINALDSRLTEVEPDVSGLQEDVSGLQAEQGMMSQSISDIQTNYATKTDESFVVLYGKLEGTTLTLRVL